MRLPPVFERQSKTKSGPGKGRLWMKRLGDKGMDAPGQEEVRTGNSFGV